MDRPARGVARRLRIRRVRWVAIFRTVDIQRLSVLVVDIALRAVYPRITSCGDREFVWSHDVRGAERRSARVVAETVYWEPVDFAVKVRKTDSCVIVWKTDSTISQQFYFCII